MKKIVFTFFICFIYFGAIAQTKVPNETKVQNLGPKVNSPYYEVRPTISEDGKTLYFVVEGNPKNKNFKKNEESQDVWYSTLDSTGNWTQAQQFQYPKGDRLFNDVFWISSAGDKMLVRGAFDNGVFVGRGISMCVKSPLGEWSLPQSLHIKDYDRMSLGKYSGAMLASDEKTLLLYFSEGKNSEVNDVYVSFLQGDGDWTKPLNLGSTINSDETDEISPFLAADRKTLYFSSNRDGGYGDHDIWMSKRLDDSWKKWTDPVNLGDSINSYNWDAFFTIDPSDKCGYLSTMHNSLGGSDLVKVILNEVLRPNYTVTMYGHIYNFSSKQLVKADVTCKNLDPTDTSKTDVSSSDGSYKIIVPVGKKYTVNVSNGSYMPIEDSLDVTAEKESKEIRKDYYLTPTPVVAAKDTTTAVTPANEESETAAIKKAKKKSVGAKEGEEPATESNNDVAANKVTKSKKFADRDFVKEPLKSGEIIQLKNILFDFGKASLRKKSQEELNKLAKVLKKNPDVKISLSAHTDNIGTDKSNLILSRKRASSTKSYLVTKGVSAHRIAAKGYGERRPIATNKTAAGRQKNRRVEIRVK